MLALSILIGCNGDKLFNASAENTQENAKPNTGFHDELLKDGSMPLTTLENKMDRWAEAVK